MAILLGCAAPAASPAREVYGLSEAELGLYLGNALLSSWRVAEARRLADRLLAENPENGNAKAFDAHVLFFEGRYGDSLRRLGELGVEGPFRDLVRATEEATRGFRSRASEHFELLWEDPKDEVLIEPGLQALEAARKTLAEELGFEPQERVRIEIYPTVASFTAVSTLTRKEVETSGTIGLCKFNRIMITSPRATLWGYRWRDTLCHEYVHLALYRLSHGTAPIWAHEGVAKYFEASWRGVLGELDPSSEALLARRLEQGTLIPLEDMSPSVAKLPSAEETSLAFAQVGTMIRFLVELRGRDGPRRLVESMGSGRTDREALEDVWGGTFAEFETAWREWAAQLPLRKESVQVIGLKLAERGAKDEEAPGVIPDPQGRDFVRLGDLLRARGREKAAAAEYEKAYAEAPETPGIASRHALGLLTLSRFGEAVEVSERALQLYPDLAVLWQRKGEALLALGRAREAAESFREVLEVNPFHLPGRSGLLMAARAMGDEAEAGRQEWALELLEK